MKKLLLAAVVLLPLALAAQTKHVKLTNDGAFASVQTNDPTSNFFNYKSRAPSQPATTPQPICFSFLPPLMPI